MICENCGAELQNPHQKFCQNCGIPIKKKKVFKFSEELEEYQELGLEGDVPLYELLDSDYILLFVDPKYYRIWIWQGKNATSRMKFISARFADNIIDRFGIAFKIICVDEGNEPVGFKVMVGLEKEVDYSETQTRPASEGTEEDLNLLDSLKKEKIHLVLEKAFQPLTGEIGIPGTSYRIQLGLIDGKWATRLLKGREVIDFYVLKPELARDGFPNQNLIVGWLLRIIALPNINPHNVMRIVQALIRSLTREKEKLLSGKIKMFVALSYFNTRIGPMIFYSYPHPQDKIGKEISDRLYDDMTQQNGEEFFIHSFEEFKFLNYYFEIPSEWGRGNNEMLMSSVVIQHQISLEVEKTISSLSREFATEMQSNKDIFTGLYINRLSNYVKADKDRIRKNESLIKTYVNNLYWAVVEDTREEFKVDKGKELEVNEALKMLKLYLLRRGEGDGDDDYDYFPYPYIFKPPTPPKDLGVAGQLQARKSDISKDPEFTPYCKYCGATLGKGESICHVCGNKVE